MWSLTLRLTSTQSSRNPKTDQTWRNEEDNAEYDDDSCFAGGPIFALDEHVRDCVAGWNVGGHCRLWLELLAWALSLFSNCRNPLEIMWMQWSIGVVVEAVCWFVGGCSYINAYSSFDAECLVAQSDCPRNANGTKTSKAYMIFSSARKSCASQIREKSRRCLRSLN